MATFTVKTAKGTHADPSVFTEATESNAVRYRLRNLMNQPCQAVVTLNDPDFASWQKYSAKGVDAYFGLYSRLTIADTSLAPTLEFNGPVVRVSANPKEATLDLHCRDWLHQLATQKIVYDTREDLNGHGLRESKCYRMSVTSMHGIIDSGGNYRLYDTVAGWANGAWTATTHYLTFSSKMGGTGSFWQAISAATLNGCNTEGGNYSTTWIRGVPWTIEADANDNIDVVIDVACNISGASVDEIRVEFEYGIDDAKANWLKLEVYESDTPGYQEIYLDETLPTSTSTYVYKILTDIAGAINLANTDIIDTTNHRLRFKFTTDTPGGGVEPILFFVYFRVTLSYKGAAVNTTAYEIDEDGASYIEVSEDLPGAQLDKHSPYSVTRPITVYVADLVTTYDVSTTLDVTTDLVASTNVITRHIQYMSPLVIMRQLASADGTEFWLDGDKHLHWNDPYTTNGTTVTDADVLYWLNPNVGTDQEYANRVTVLGQRSTTTQIISTKDNEIREPGLPPDDPLDYYGIHIMVKQNPGIHTKHDGDNYAQALVDRVDDPAVHVSYAIMGHAAAAKGWRDIGDVVKINSTDLGLSNQWYVVTETRYDSDTGIQEVYLTPRATDGLFHQQQLLDGTRWVRGELADTRSHINFDPLHTETW